MKITTAAYASAALLAWTGAAQAAPPAALKDVAAWASRNLSDVDDLPLLGFNELGMTLGSPAGATLRVDGLVEGDIRQEFFEPIEHDGEIMRSSAARWMVDCARQQYAVVRITLYSRNNLQGQLSERETEPPSWLPRNRLSEHAIDAMCAAKNGGPLDARPNRR